jgi:hypothetical protein
MMGERKINITLLALPSLSGMKAMERTTTALGAN